MQSLVEQLRLLPFRDQLRKFWLELVVNQGRNKRIKDQEEKRRKRSEKRKEEDHEKEEERGEKPVEEKQD